MPYDLRAFIADLEQRGDLVRVKAQVDPRLEVSEVYDRVVKRGGPALLFEDVKGAHGMPVLINAFGTDARMALALGREPAQVGKDLMALVKTRPPRSFREMISLARRARDVLKFPPRRVRRAACQQIVETGDAVDLTRLPVLTCWPLDAGPFITLPQVYTRDPETGERNMGMYRMQVFGPRETGMHWQTHKHGAEHFRKAKKLGVRLPVAVALGGDPALTYGATAPLPPGFDEVMLCGYIRRERMRMVKCKTVDLEVPADAEIVLEGYVDPAEPLRTEGPFGDHTGYYSLADEFPVFHVTAVTRRRDAIYPTTVVGIPPQEDGPMGKATERMFLELARFQVPEVVDWSMPVEAAFHNLMIVSIRKRYPGHARKAMMSLWGAGMISLEKALVIVDEDVDVHDPAALLAAFARFDPPRDLLIVDQVPTDTLDHAAPRPDLGSHLGIDLTTPIGAEPARATPAGGPLPPLDALRAKVPDLVDARQVSPRLALASIRKGPRGRARDAMRALWGAGVPEAVALVALDADVDVRDARAALFHASANLDPARDVLREGVRVGVDGTVKRVDEDARPWPPIIRMDEATKALVDKRWPEYGVGP
ncbi:MAG: 4-hydroxy-3-polyprenylbenzoate decarboxylase [Thermoplasmata archaeon]|jgi:4-hydroxy-3-polyprenylbenzoate decarboxylase|nr:4-hydroxy-3-polyprenylbenzoate decarboxylase [Thermoplasmata archaeon]